MNATLRSGLPSAPAADNLGGVDKYVVHNSDGFRYPRGNTGIGISFQTKASLVLPACGAYIGNDIELDSESDVFFGFICRLL